MRKIIFIAFWAMLMIMPAVGQVTFGVRAGGAYSSLVQKVEGTYNAGARFGFSLAGLADIHLYKGLSLRPELAFTNQGGSTLIRKWKERKILSINAVTILSRFR